MEQKTGVFGSEAYNAEMGIYVSLKTVEVWRNDKWERVRLSKVKRGEAFHIFVNEQDPNRNKTYYAQSDAYLNENIIWTITAQPVDREGV